MTAAQIAMAEAYAYGGEADDSRSGEESGCGEDFIGAIAGTGMETLPQLLSDQRLEPEPQQPQPPQPRPGPRSERELQPRARLAHEAWQHERARLEASRVFAQGLVALRRRQVPTSLEYHEFLSLP
jgi:hypothetical protein